MIRNAFTVDLEDWFQGLTSTNPRVSEWPDFESRVVPATRRLLELLERHSVKATFFVLGYVADHHPALIEAIYGAGHEIAVHGYYHRFVYRLTPDEFASDLDQSVAAVSRITGEVPLGHRAPYFSVHAGTGWAFEIMASRGLVYDSSVFPARSMLYGFPGAPRAPYQLPGLSLVEFPVTTARLFGRNWPVGGGFYNRALPYSLTARALRRVSAEGLPIVLYVHPWELDTGQNYRRVTPRERVTHYWGRAALEAKLERLFSDFPFTTLRNLLFMGAMPYSGVGHPALRDAEAGPAVAMEART
jgi:polysaccharide deacetylase family protein (PEP-CTERM system associated)